MQVVLGLRWSRVFVLTAKGYTVIGYAAGPMVCQPPMLLDVIYVRGLRRHVETDLHRKSRTAYACISTLYQFKVTITG